MDKNRLETFSDGVIAIIITIMALGLSVENNPSLESYLQAWPKFASYAISFVFVGLYWYSHHHLFHTAKKVNNKVLWLNMLNLFWLSLIPFATASMGENSFTSRYCYSICHSVNSGYSNIYFSCKSIVPFARRRF